MAEKAGNKKRLVLAIIGIALVLCGVITVFVWRNLKNRPKPEDTTETYFSLLNDKKYDEMYELLDDDTKGIISKEDFVTRNQNIYEGMEASDVKVKISKEKDSSKDTETVTYHTTMKTVAGEVSFDNQMMLSKNKEKEYRISWDSTLIFPALEDGYKVRVDTKSAKRGRIYDRNGTALAQEGAILEVGLVPGKMNEDSEADLQRISEILDVTVEDIQNSLSASYVKEDTFVPLKKISVNDMEKQEQLLQIPGILINETVGRIYPLGIAAGHLTGYIQPITAEELEKRAGEGYTANSLIGKAGAERAFEEELRAVNGSAVRIIDGNGNLVEELAATDAQDGQDVYLTIDAGLQQIAYEQFVQERAAAAAMNPKTGEVLALVSTPAYDPNEFIMGLSANRWEELANGADQPLLNRYNSTWVPGSTFKPITAAIGVEKGIISPDENLGNVGKSWQKDASWGNYYVTTLEDYGDEVNLENALVYSDNIYFARQALNIGSDAMIEGMKAMGFEEELPLKLGVQTSTYGDNGMIDSDIQLADTGYGQGKLLVNPVHMLSMYSMFVNDGNMIQPTILTKEGSTGHKGKVWKKQVISPENAELIKNDLIQVIENPEGTGANARIEGLTMLGKTGTAEMKESQDDAEGIERGWFLCETTDDIEKPVAVVGMVEDVRGKGGSHYVSEKLRNIVAGYEGK